MHRLIFFEPGHFHAALTLRISNPRVDPVIHLYAVPGEERDNFVSLVEAFNSRAEAPTNWQIISHGAENREALLERLIEDRAGDAIILAGKNDAKLATIATLHRAGFPVLADKPWATTIKDIDPLREVTSGGPVALDIMTSRYDAITQLRQALVADANIFGAFRQDEDPAISISSIHHLVKTVNGATLQRPPWYFDVTVQGDGVVDIQSHMTDQAQGLVNNGQPFDFDADVRDLRARRWSTPVPLALYRQSTGQEAFEPGLTRWIQDDVLGLNCNGEVSYELRGTKVRQYAEWRAEEPSGGGDLVDAAIRGDKADVLVRQGPETGYQAELHLAPHDSTVESALKKAVASWQTPFPGVGGSPSDLGFKIDIPNALQTTHETHFAMVLESFLDALDNGAWPDGAAERIRMRYTLLAQAHAACVADK